MSNYISGILNAIKKLDSTLKPTSIQIHPDGYLIIAPKTKPGETDYDDPYYILSKDLKTITRCIITPKTVDILKEAFEKEPIWSRYD